LGTQEGKDRHSAQKIEAIPRAVMVHSAGESDIFTPVGSPFIAAVAAAPACGTLHHSFPPHRRARTPMARSAAPPVMQFSFDHMVAEVNAIVEDLRWLHLELTLRNRCNEVMFLDVRTEEEVLDLAFKDLCRKIDAMELTVFVRDKDSYRIGFREMETNVPWADDAMPWVTPIARWFSQMTREPALPKADISHYSVNAVPITAVTMPIVIGREHLAAILIVTLSATLVPRLRKLLAGLSGSLGLSIDYVRKGGRGDAGSPALTKAAAPPPPAASASERRAALQDALVDRIPGYAFVIDRHFMIVGAGEAFLRGADRDTTIVGFPVEDLIPHGERGLARQTLITAFDQPGEQIRLPFPPARHGGHSLPADWWTTTLDDPGGEGTLLLLFAANAGGDAARIAPAAAPEASTDSRLSKQYRFLMKYVPFPVVHIDETGDTIRNANPAFEELLGTHNWEGVPLADFATLTVHPAFGDTAPCTLSVISHSGISLSYRGIITPLRIFGKLIREIKFDPLEQ
jgi:PAS domain-containing protein